MLVVSSSRITRAEGMGFSSHRCTDRLFTLRRSRIISSGQREGPAGHLRCGPSGSAQSAPRRPPGHQHLTDSTLDSHVRHSDTHTQHNLSPHCPAPCCDKLIPSHLGARLTSTKAIQRRTYAHMHTCHGTSNTAAGAALCHWHCRRRRLAIPCTNMYPVPTGW